RLILRPWSGDDAEECFKYACDPSVGPTAGWPPHKSVEESRQVIRDILSAPETYAVVLKETGLPIGSASLMPRPDDPVRGKECEIGYWIGRPYWGLGIATEAAEALLRRAFTVLGCASVRAGYYEGNAGSRRVQEKCGFKYVKTVADVPVRQLGETRTVILNRLTKEEWLKLQEDQ
ncbi:MAG: GNAT family N-acetyltransferase, partial [Firmicutes bacterium]|nr:GNAT family N-acetyltransferase [Bacillota bacterium]